MHVYVPPFQAGRQVPHGAGKWPSAYVLPTHWLSAAGRVERVGWSGEIAKHEIMYHTASVSSDFFGLGMCTLTFHWYPAVILKQGTFFPASYLILERQ